MDINKAITYVFEDEKWVTKSLIGLVLSVLGFLIIPIFFVQGYLVGIVRNVMDGVEFPLPEWDDWGKLFKDGLNLFIALFVYALPAILLVGCGMLLFLPAGMASGDAAEALAAGGGLGFTLLACLAMLWGLAMVVLSPAITIQYAREGSLGACFRFSEVIAFTREHLGDIIIAVAVLLGIGLVLGLVGVIPLIGWLIALAASIYTTFVSGHLFGQIGAKAGGAKEKSYTDPTVM
ncbi:MAG: DUF4013 domain-containing protein [Candidatus Promineifilaceae bacterium]